MANDVVDLWPEDLRVKDEETPALLLRQQAVLLGERLRGRVEAEVVTQALPGGRLAHGFRLKASVLGGYTHTLFYAVHHKGQPYPVEIHKALAAAETEANPVFLCQDQPSFEATLRDLFASPGTRKTIESLLVA
jgi:hypothetical protein